MREGSECSGGMTTADIDIFGSYDWWPMNLCILSDDIEKRELEN